MSYLEFSERFIFERKFRFLGSDNYWGFIIFILGLKWCNCFFCFLPFFMIPFSYILKINLNIWNFANTKWPEWFSFNEISGSGIQKRISLTIFAKNSIVDIRLDSKYASGFTEVFELFREFLYHSLNKHLAWKLLWQIIINLFSYQQT